MKAPVGPPIWTRLPPSAEIRKPPNDRGDETRGWLSARCDGDSDA
jgi:hypothetical protein